MATPVPQEGKVAYTFVGKAGLRVSNIALGAWNFGEEPGSTRVDKISEEDSHKLLDRFAEWGGNFVDTSNVYGTGRSEEIIGSWLSKRERDRYVIATKVRFNMDPTNPNQIGLGRRHITQAVEDSLRRLNTHFIDLYQETLLTMHDLVRCGKVRYVGASNTSGWQIQKLVDTADKLGIPPVATLQQQYSLLQRESEIEAFQVCKLEGIGVLPWSPLKGGLLTGKYQRDKVPTEGRLGWAAADEKRANETSPAWSKIKEDERVWNVLDVCKKFADKYGRTVSQVALRWLLQKDIVPAVIVGARTLDQLDQNMGANGWTLSAEEMAELDEVSAIPIPYPHEFIKKVNVIRTNPWQPSCYIQNQ
ncbi:hypothetical protein BaRGS_00005091 [Batillaria attramentaria]|uniref:NADP-dependent oxidoreductase domain-containing protein n=1 Tax=Batillaria attramentaria TaxID=370345 RepID=A0ABD0LVL0_9CAEN